MSKILIIEARFYPDIADMLVVGASKVLEEAAVAYERIEVPGVFEIPAAVHFAASSDDYDGFVALGCVIRGETTHYDYVCLESARGLNDLALQGVAIGYGILTTENEEQAIIRADIAQKNKGADAAHACLTMVALKKRFKKQ